LIIDYMYGVAACKRWGLPAIEPIVEKYLHEHFESIPLLSRSEPFRQYEIWLSIPARISV
jgi:hypothetical protein